MATPDRATLRRALAAEFVGTAMLLIGVVGSGIMAERLSTDVGLQLLQNAFATGAVLVALILALSTASGAHFNPAVTAAALALGDIDGRTAGFYVAVQVPAAIVGVVLANLMFDLDAVTWSTKDRSDSSLMLAEVIATFGLVMVIFALVRAGKATSAPYAVGAYIAGAYYFTSSTSFANPAVTVGRMFSDTFAGIEPASVPAFIGAQLIGTVLAVYFVSVIHPSADREPRPGTS